jgi:hypothetical protein
MLLFAEFLHDNASPLADCSGYGERAGILTSCLVIALFVLLLFHENFCQSNISCEYGPEVSDDSGQMVFI